MYGEKSIYVKQLINEYDNGSAVRSVNMNVDRSIGGRVTCECICEWLYDCVFEHGVDLIYSGQINY